MTLLHFTLGALPYSDKSKGTHIIHAYLHQSEPTRTDSPGDERRAAKDCAQILGDIIRRNVNEDEERLLQEGEIPAEVLPIYTYAIGVAWDREAMMPSYKMMDYATLWPERKFTPVLSLGAELYHTTFDILKNRERSYRAKANAPKYKWDAQTLAHGRKSFAAYCKQTKARHIAWNINRMRFECALLRNGYCSPSKPSCPCYRNGKCVEVKA